jgi:3-hydroxy-D-aspartate aldolase
VSAVGPRGPNEPLIGEPGSRERLGTPALILDLPAMEANIASMAAHARARGVALRPVAKIHKSVEIARRQIRAGAIGVCCATLAEAELMADAGIPGLLLFSPIVGDAKLARLAALNAGVEGLLVAADAPARVDDYIGVARRSGRTLQLLVDIDVGGGRTGARADDVVELARIIDDAPELEFAGVQAYSGMYQNTTDYQRRRELSVTLLAPLRRALEQLQSAGLPPRIVSGAGTGTHDLDTDLALFTELQVGSYLFMDMHYRDAILRAEDPHPFHQALFVRTGVISAVHGDFVVTDAGMKEIDGLLGVDHPLIFRGAPDHAVYSIVGDNMGRVDLSGATELLPVGSALELVAPHCFQTVSMYSHYHVVEGDILKDIWPIQARTNW